MEPKPTAAKEVADVFKMAEIIPVEAAVAELLIDARVAILIVDLALVFVG